MLNENGTTNEDRQINLSDKAEKANSNVIYVCDIDLMADYFVDIRNQPIRNGINYRFQNMAFVLNAIDSMANETTYLDIRNRRDRHVTLRVVERTTDNAMGKVYQATQDFEKDYQTEQNKLRSNMEQKLRPLAEKIQKMQDRQQRGLEVNLTAMNSQIRIFEQIRQQQAEEFNRKVTELNNERREKLRSIQLTAEVENPGHSAEFQTGGRRHSSHPTPVGRFGGIYAASTTRTSRYFQSKTFEVTARSCNGPFM